MNKLDIDHQTVIDLYEKYENAREVAEVVGCCSQTVYRILEKRGIPRTHRHDKPVQHIRVTNCKTKYCPAVVAICIACLDMTTREVSDYLSMPPQSVNGILTRRHPELKKKWRTYQREVDMDAIEAEYLAGASCYELGDKYGVNHATVNKWMRKRGHKRGHTKAQLKIAAARGHETLRQNAINRLEAELYENTGGTISLVEYDNRRSTFKCNVCGLVFTRCRDSKWSNPNCPKCTEEKRLKEDKQKHEERSRLKAERAAVVAAEYAKEKRCQCCGDIYHSEIPTSVYCSKKCARRARDRRRDRSRQTTSGYRSRAKKYGVVCESGITLKRVINKFNNVCQICGKPCDPNDRRWGSNGPLYPSIDHVIALANGGGHTWDNVQLAHCICNSYKGDRLDNEQTKAVIDCA